MIHTIVEMTSCAESMVYSVEHASDRIRPQKESSSWLHPGVVALNKNQPTLHATIGAAFVTVGISDEPIRHHSTFATTERRSAQAPRLPCACPALALLPENPLKQTDKHPRRHNQQQDCEDLLEPVHRQRMRKPNTKRCGQNTHHGNPSQGR